MKCLLCADDVEGNAELHLQCCSCENPLHYQCGMGYEDPVKAFKTSTGKQQYKCPICIVGSSYNFIHLALKKHEQLATTTVPAAADGDKTTVPAGDNNSTVPTESDETGVVDDSAAPNPHHVTHDNEHDNVDSESTLSHISHVDDLNRSITLGQRPRSSTGGSGVSFRPVLSDHELRRVKRCKGMLYGLKNIPTSVDSLMLLDSNGRDIKAENIDGTGSKLCLRQIGGLCCAATTQALKECKQRYPRIKALYLGLGTNDHLHRLEHPGLRTDYIKRLDHEVRIVFPKADIHFLLPFSAIKSLGSDYVKALAASIKDAGVRWKVHKSPAMEGKLVAPKFIHLTVEGRSRFTKWLKKECGFKSSPGASVLPSSVLPPTSSGSSIPPTPPVGLPFTVSQVHAGVELASGGISRCPPLGAGQCLHGVGNRMESSESTPLHIDRLIKERLFQLVMAPQPFTRHHNY